MNTIYRLRTGVNSNGYAERRASSEKEVVRCSDGKKFIEHFPGEAVFQWRRRYTRQPDCVQIPGFYPVVSDHVRRFCNDQGYSGIQFHQAREVAAGPYNEVPDPDGSTWWVMSPSVRVPFDLELLCGPDCALCPETNHFVSRTGSVSYPSVWLPIGKIETDFFGISDLPWHPGLFCGEIAKEGLTKQKFKNMAFGKNMIDSDGRESSYPLP